MAIPDRDNSYTTPEAQDAYLESLRLHITNVQKAGEIIGGIPQEQLQRHDDSKFSIYEFPFYARHFHGDKGDRKGFTRAWHHHLHNNPHHPEYWLLPNKSGVTGALAMPENYAREMVADWLGAELTYGESWDMSDWLNENFGSIKMHPETVDYVWGILLEIGYQQNDDGIYLADMSKYPSD